MQHPFLVFDVSEQLAAFPLQDLERIAPMAMLLRPPGLPAILEGFLNLAGVAVPVVRLDLLLRLPPQRPGLYSMLILLNGATDGLIALLVDRVSEVLSVDERALVDTQPEHSFNGCCKATFELRSRQVHVLSPARIFMEKERQILFEFQAVARLRLQDWEREAH